MFPQGVDTGFLGFHKLAMGFKAAKTAATQTSSKMRMWTIFLMQQSDARPFIALSVAVRLLIRYDSGR
jgi:hypothetical protein